MKRVLEYTTILLLSVAIGCSSCTNESNGESDATDNAVITLTLKMPQTASTRSISPTDENLIDEVDVLALIEKNSKWVLDYKATKVQKSVSGNILTVKAKVRELPVPQRFVVLANSSSQLTLAAPVQGERIEDIEERLICAAGSGVWPANTNESSDFIPFPMYALTDAGTISANDNHTIGTYPMIRMVARIDVSLDAGISNFVLTEAYLFNYTTAGYISYFKSDFNLTPVIAVRTPAVPAAGDHSGFPVLRTNPYAAHNGEITRTIYTFESEAITTEAGKTRKTALVIGGSYTSGTTSYYRIELKTDDDQSDNISSGVLRNHLYNVKVRSVTGQGYDTPEEAYQGKSRLTTQVVAWNLADQNVVIDRQYNLTVSCDEFSCSATGEQIMIVAATDYDDAGSGFPEGVWVAEQDVAYEPEVAAGNGWITFSDISGTNGDLERTIGVTASPNNTGAERSAMFFVKAGHLTKIIRISQPHL